MANGSAPYLRTQNGVEIDHTPLARKIDRIVFRFEDYSQFCQDGEKVSIFITSYAKSDTALRSHPVAGAALAKLEAKAHEANLQVDYHYDGKQLVGELQTRH